MKNIMAFGAMKNMVCCIAVLLPLQVNISTYLPINDENTNEYVIDESNSDTPLPSDQKVVLMDLNSEYCDTKCFLLQNREKVDFISDIFAIDSDLVIENLIEINSNAKFDEYNIGRLIGSDGNLKTYNSFDRGLIEYLYEYSQDHPEKVDNKVVPYTGSSEYVVDLIKYFTSLYDNVDYLTAVSIGAAESGHYKVEYMLRANNVYGGMSSRGLIKYKNIEYGVLSYIRLLSNNYYGRGLNTLESIGRVYCPSYDANGNKVASSHWLSLVRSAMNKYEETYSTVTVSELIND